MTDLNSIRAAIRNVPDFPKPGILFKDITPILGDAALFRAAVDFYAECCRQTGANRLAAIEARGLLFGGAVADRLGLGLAPVRKKGKLPYHTYEETYDLEYGTATLTLHQDAFRSGDRVLIVDDLLATGGTALATARLVERTGAQVAGMAFLIELAFLKGRDKLGGYRVFAPIVF